MGNMRKTIIAMALLMVVGAPAAMAHSGNSGSGMSKGSSIPQAPIGHRQPRAGDVPSEKNLSDPNNPVNKEDAILDKKIKSICRGC